MSPATGVSLTDPDDELEDEDELLLEEDELEEDELLLLLEVFFTIDRSTQLKLNPPLIISRRS